jgi:hypothetical protein
MTLHPGNGDGNPPYLTQDRPLGELLSDLAQDARSIVSLELALARSEMAEKVSSMGKSAGFVAAGGLVAFAGFLAIIAALIIAFGNLIPLWLSALLIGVVVAVVGYALAQKGLSDIKNQSLAPKRAIQSLREDKEWLEESLR